MEEKNTQQFDLSTDYADSIFENGIITAYMRPITSTLVQAQNHMRLTKETFKEYLPALGIAVSEIVKQSTCPIMR